MPEDRDGAWARARGCLEEGAAALSHVDPMFWEFLDHNELGLAFEVLADAAERQTNTPDNVWAALLAAMRLMELTPEDPVHGSAAATVLRHDP
ncbi:MAG: hypothetical protein JF603_06170 [Acidobacteria bacterium]|nr:hypothetical protein [Acidobacteriota bacterium]